MARIDQEAARREMDKAAECNAHAEELSQIAEMLRQRALYHIREADELRGTAHRRHHRRTSRIS